MTNELEQFRTVGVEILQFKHYDSDSKNINLIISSLSPLSTGRMCFEMDVTGMIKRRQLGRKRNSLHLFHQQLLKKYQVVSSSYCIMSSNPPRQTLWCNAADDLIREQLMVFHGESVSCQSVKRFLALKPFIEKKKFPMVPVGTKMHACYWNAGDSVKCFPIHPSKHFTMPQIHCPLL